MPNAPLQFAFLLVDQKNLYQRMLQADAEAAARRVGVDLEVRYCGLDAGQQIQQFFTYLQAEPGARPKAIIIVPHRDAVLARAAREAVQAGIGLAVLNRIPEGLDAVRADFPKVPVLTFAPDQRQIGRIQGQQFLKLLPAGGHVAYIRGDTSTASSKERQAGMEETVRGTAVKVTVLDGGWVSEQAQKSVTFWLRSMATMKAPVDLIGCQNDDMAVGARAAVDAVAVELGRPELKEIPITGCDGLPDVGQKLVATGAIAATIVNPPTSGAAVQALARFYQQGQQVPPRTVLEPRSFPVLMELHPKPKASPGRK